VGHGGRRQVAVLGLVAVIALCGLGALGCAADNSSRNPSPTGLQLTGSVVNRDGKPLEGAYMLAGYYVKSVGVAMSGDICEKTKGMFTGPDGQFRFPVERLDVPSPNVPAVILTGYYLYQLKIPTLEAQQRKDASSYSGFVYIMDKQDPSSPQLRTARDAYCGHTLDDAAAGITFMEFELREYQLYGRQHSNLEASLRDRRAEFGLKK
jgi:hypothetical protein